MGFQDIALKRPFGIRRMRAGRSSRFAWSCSSKTPAFSHGVAQTVAHGVSRGKGRDGRSAPGGATETASDERFFRRPAARVLQCRPPRREPWGTSPAEPEPRSGERSVAAQASFAPPGLQVCCALTHGSRRGLLSDATPWLRSYSPEVWPAENWSIAPAGICL